MKANIKHYWIENWSEFIGYLGKPTAGSIATGYHSDFHGCKTAKEAMDLAINGWADGLKQVEKLGSLMDAELKGSLMLDEYYYDVVGQDFDLDRVLMDEPEAWLNTYQVEVKAPATHTVKLVVNGATSAWISDKQMIARGACIMALVSLLERGRKRVEIELVFNVETGAKEARITVPIKSASQDLDLNKVAFALAHPDSCRRFQFATWDALDKAVAERGFGHPVDITLAEQQKEGIGIYVGQGYNECDFSKPESAKKWILEKLKEQGVELKQEVR